MMRTHRSPRQESAGMLPGPHIQCFDIMETLSSSGDITDEEYAELMRASARLLHVELVVYWIHLDLAGLLVGGHGD